VYSFDPYCFTDARYCEAIEQQQQQQQQQLNPKLANNMCDTNLF
jgi:hypothetical protein